MLRYPTRRQCALIFAWLRINSFRLLLRMFSLKTEEMIDRCLLYTDNAKYRKYTVERNRLRKDILVRSMEIVKT